jgi:hypothetical protein
MQMTMLEIKLKKRLPLLRNNKMKRYAVLVCVVMLSAIQIIACNSCGCDITSRIYPNDFARFIGIGYTMNHFKGQHGEGSLRHEYYQRADIFGKLAFNDRLELIFNVPYMSTVTKSEGTVDDMINGIGDITVMGRYALYDSASSGLSKRFVIGGGIEAPTGKNNVKNSVGNIIQPFQPGNGAWDVLLNANYALRNLKYGFVADAGYKLHTKNSNGFRRPNFFSLNVEALKYINVNKTKLAPKLLTSFDQTFKATGNDSTLSFLASRHFFSLGLGLDCAYKSFFISASYRLPVYQSSITTQQLKNTNRFQFTMGFVF